MRILSDNEAIYMFRGEWRFLSNFYPAEIEYEGVIYPTNENFYQAMKSTNPTYRDKMIDATPYEAKEWGQSVRLRKDWDLMKIGIMEYGVRKKFEHKELRERLLSMTKDYHIYEGNDWDDTFWGVDINDNLHGQNNLGKIIMKIRNEIKDQQ